MNFNYIQLQYAQIGRRFERIYEGTACNHSLKSSTRKVVKFEAANSCNLLIDYSSNLKFPF